jgi:hypothetical protein
MNYLDYSKDLLLLLQLLSVGLLAVLLLPLLLTSLAWLMTLKPWQKPSRVTQKRRPNWLN